MKTIHFLENGEKVEVPNKKAFTLEELQAFVGGHIEIFDDMRNKGMVFVVNETGIYSKQINEGIREKFSIGFYGNVLWCRRKLIN